MKRAAGIVSILFVIALLWKDIAAFSWNVWFYNNQVELAAKYCVNKKKPMLHCNGKCYLAKQLKQLEQEEKNNQPVPKMPLKLQELMWTSDFKRPDFMLSLPKPSSGESIDFFYPNTSLISFSGSVFHPPARG